MTREEKQQVFNDLCGKYQAMADCEEPNYDEMDILARQIGEMRSDTSLYLLFVWPDQHYAELKVARVYENDNESPDGCSHDIHIRSANEDGSKDDFDWWDGGALWGYWSAKTAMENEMASALPEEEALIYDASDHDIIYDDDLEMTWNIVEEIMKNNKPMTWAEVED